MIIPVKKLIAIFRRMYDERWKYEWGAARAGCVDCSGAFVWAYKQFNDTIYHGSNTIARKYIKGGLLPVSEAKPGMAAFKAREPGSKYYWRPSKFKDDEDQTDYYHIGLVDATGQFVLNAQSTSAGFTRTPIVKWARVGELKDVDYSESTEEHAETGDWPRVHVTRGSTVNVRSGPSKSTPIKTRIDNGSIVELLDTTGEWSHIRYWQEGYVMSEFLQK